MGHQLCNVQNFCNNQRMYGIIRNQLIDMYELEEKAEYLEAIKLINIGLGFYPETFSIENEKTLKDLERLIGGVMLRSSRVYSGTQRYAIELTKRLALQFDNSLSEKSL